MLKQRTLFSILALAAMMLATPAQAAPGDAFRGSAYTLGIHLAFASFQATQDQSADGWSGRSCTGSLMLESEAIDEAVQVEIRLRNAGVQADPPPRHGTCVTLSSTEVENWRTALSVQLARQSPVLGTAYNLAVNLGIAEAQANVGEPARQIVYVSLNNAKPLAQALGLDVTTLDLCIFMAAGSTPMSEIYSRLSSLRGAYQAALN